MSEPQFVQIGIDPEFRKGLQWALRLPRGSEPPALIATENARNGWSHGTLCRENAYRAGAADSFAHPGDATPTEFVERWKLVWADYRDGWSDAYAERQTSQPTHYACMSLVERQPLGHDDWTQTVCPECRRACWWQPVMALLPQIFPGYQVIAVCTDCATRRVLGSGGIA